MLYLLMLVLGCGCAPKTPPNTNTPTDADTDTDGAAVEDCDNGQDDDQDGLTDCEDSDCLEDCIEDCSNEQDDDNDGLSDCEDDECFSDPSCYTVEMATNFVPFPGEYNYGMYLYWGDVESVFGQRAILTVYAELSLTATNASTNEGFSCTGHLYGLGYGDGGLGNLGLRYIGGADGTVDYAFAGEFNTANNSLRWDGDCPVSALRPFEWGFYTNTEGFVARRDAGATTWQQQYRANVVSAFYYNPAFEGGLGMGVFNSFNTVSWRGRYDR